MFSPLITVLWLVVTTVSAGTGMVCEERLKNVKEVKLLKTSKKIHEAEVTFENDEIEITELIIVENAELTKDVIEYKKIPKAIYKNRNFSDKLNIPILNIRNQEKIVVATTTLTK